MSAHGPGLHVVCSGALRWAIAGPAPRHGWRECVPPSATASRRQGRAPLPPPAPADEARRAFLERLLAEARGRPVPEVLPEHAALAQRLRRLQEGYPARFAEWQRQRSEAAAADAAAAVAAEAAAGLLPLVGSPRAAAPPAAPARVPAAALVPAATAEAPRPQAEQEAQPFRQVLASPAGSPRVPPVAAAAIASPIAAAAQVRGLRGLCCPAFPGLSRQRCTCQCVPSQTANV